MTSDASTSKHALCFESGLDLATAMAAGKLSALEVTQAFIDAINDKNEAVNAVVTLDEVFALKAAAVSDAKRAAGELKGLPLAGVPFLAKDLDCTAGMRTTFGSLMHKDYVPSWDMTHITRLKDAGCILIGKTNTPEDGVIPNTYNDVFGITRNPWNLDRAPGGSSGGSAAAVAAGFAPLTTGSDGGGSIRIPSALCGVFGFKSTFGAIPFGPKGIGVCNSLGHLGPITRNVSDGAAMMDIMAGTDERDRMSLSLTSSMLDGLDSNYKPGKIGYSSDFGHVPLRHGVREAFEALLEKLRGAGWILEEAHPILDGAEQAIATTVSFEWGTIPMEIADADPKGFDTSTDYLKAVVERRRDLTLNEVWESHKIRKNLCVEMGRFFDEYDLLITPTLPCEAFDAGKPWPFLEDSPEEPDFTLNRLVSPFNLTGDPACSLPMGFSENGLPLGLQIVAPRHEDLRVFQAAYAVEQITDAWKRRPPHGI